MLKRRTAVAAFFAGYLAFAATANAQNAMWSTAPISGVWNTPANWTPAAVPTGTAGFGASSITSITFSAAATIGAFRFDAGAPAYTFNNGSTMTLTGAGIINNSSLQPVFNNLANSVINFRNFSTASNSIINNSYALYFYDASTAASATINNIGNTNITFRNSSTAGNAVITNTGIGASTQFGTFGAPADSPTAGNATIITNSGALVGFFDHSTAGDATVITHDGGQTLFGIFVTPEHSNGGNARFVTDAGGIVDFSGTSGPASDGHITAGSIEGAGTYLLGSNQLTVGGNNLSTEVSGVIEGSGSLIKVGIGTLALTGANTYSGPTSVNGGILDVNGSLVSAVTVNSGGTLGGNGFVGDTLINGGTLAPGNSIGLLTVQGNLVFTAASSYMVEVSPANADRVNVMGIATLGGATVNAAFAPGTYVAKQYTILAATGGVSGSFAGPVNTNLPTNFASSLSYDANKAYLDLALNFAPPGAPGLGSGLNINQTNVANALTNFFNTSGGIPMAFGALSPQGLSQVSGELATGTQQATFDAMNMFIGVMTDPFGAGRGDGYGASNGGAAQFADESALLSYTSDGKRRANIESDAYATIYNKAPTAARFAQRWNVWAAGYGGSQNTDGNAATGSNSAVSSIYGVASGADYRISPDTIVGFALAGGGTNFNVANSGSGRSDLFQAGVFGRHTIGAAYITAALAYGWQDITTDRIVTANGFDRLRADFNANAFSGRIESGYRYLAPAFGGIGLTPYAAAQVTTFDLPAYAEQAASGTNTFALSYAAKDVTATRSELGLRTDKSFAFDEAIVTLRGRTAWAHNFDTDRSIGATFQTLPGASFIVNGAAQAADSALVTASAETRWRNGFSLAATFEGEFSDVTNSYAGKGVARYVW